MENVGEKIRIAREALGWSQTALGNKAGCSQSTVDRIEKGSGSKYLYAVAAAAGVEISLPGMPTRSQSSDTKEPPVFFDAKNQMPVFSSAEGGPGAMILDNEPYDYIPRPHNLANVPEAYGVVIEGESMSRAYRPGDIAWINPRLKERRDEDCIFRRFDNRTGEAKAMIKVLVNWTSEEWAVKQLNPPKKFKLKRSEWPECYRIVGKTNRA